MAKTADAALITSAPRRRSLDLAERQRRYIITMTIRTLCFLAFLVVPGWWKLLALGGAALLPAFAVLFANGADRRPLPAIEPATPPAPHCALPSAQVVTGTAQER